MMTRVIFSFVFVTMALMTVTVSSSQAFAQEKKGILGFFNRPSNDGTDSGGPIHMQSGIDGASNSEGSKPHDLNKREKAARFDPAADEKYNQENARKLSEGARAETARVEAEALAAVQKMEAQIEYNRQMSLIADAEARALQASRSKTGKPPAGADQGALNAARAAAQQQIAAAAAAAAGQPVPSSSSASASSSASSSSSDEPQASEPKRERKTRSFFNRIEE